MSNQSSEERVMQQHSGPKPRFPSLRLQFQRQMEAELWRVRRRAAEEEAGEVQAPSGSSDNPSLQAADVLRTAGISLLLFGGKRLDAVACWGGEKNWVSSEVLVSGNR